MSDDLNDKIQQIVQMLSQDEGPNKLKDFVSTLATTLGSNEGTSDNHHLAEEDNRDDVEDKEQLKNTELVDAAKKAMERISSNNDPRVNLLQAIKPFMNNTRQKKIGTCIQLLQVASLRSLLTDDGKEVR